MQLPNVFDHLEKEKTELGRLVEVILEACQQIEVAYFSYFTVQFIFYLELICTNRATRCLGFFVISGILTISLERCYTDLIQRG